MNQRPRIDRRLPSPVQRCAQVTQHGIVFMADPGKLEQDFVSTEEVMNRFGSADATVAHLLSKRYGRT